MDALEIAQEVERIRLCTFCGLARILDDARPVGIANQNRCGECGARLGGRPEDPATIARCALNRRNAHASIDAGLI